MTWQETWNDGVASIKEMPVATRTERHSAILAADAELKRLREAVEWACSLEVMARYQVGVDVSAVDEMRRIAGMEGK